MPTKPTRDSRPSSPGAIRRGRARPTVSGSRAPLTVWGILLLAGGILTWSVIPRSRPDVPDVWKVSAASSATESQMISTIRELGSDSPTLLRLEWPEHPAAVEYRIRFRTSDGAPGPTPLAVRSSVFLYDLQSDVLALPRVFEWEVTAVLPDGSEIVSPWRRHPAR